MTAIGASSSLLRFGRRSLPNPICRPWFVQPLGGEEICALRRLPREQPKERYYAERERSSPPEMLKCIAFAVRCKLTLQ